TSGRGRGLCTHKQDQDSTHVRPRCYRRCCRRHLWPLVEIYKPSLRTAWGQKVRPSVPARGSFSPIELSYTGRRSYMRLEYRTFFISTPQARLTRTAFSI